MPEDMRQDTASFRQPVAARQRLARTRRRALRATLVLAAVAVAHAGSAANPTGNEVTAKFVFQLLKYVSWPPSAIAETAPFVVGVLGDDSLVAELRSVVSDQRAHGHAVEVRSVADAASPGIHLLFVRGADASALRELARQHHSTTVLTVADRFDFPSLGGDVGIEMVGERVSFSINRRKSVRGDFEISSKLLRLASEVK
jgi:hypothetical protein